MAFKAPQKSDTTPTLSGSTSIKAQFFLSRIGFNHVYDHLWKSVFENEDNYFVYKNEFFKEFEKYNKKCEVYSEKGSFTK